MKQRSSAVTFAEDRQTRHVAGYFCYTVLLTVSAKNVKQHEIMNQYARWTQDTLGVIYGIDPLSSNHVTLLFV